MDVRHYAEKQLEECGFFKKDNTFIGDCVLELINTFADQRHSPHTAKLTAEAFSKVALFESLKNDDFLKDGSFVFIPKENTTSEEILEFLNANNIESVVADNGRVQVGIKNGGKALGLLKETNLNFGYGS